jgi:RES domain-containing protein
VTVAYRLASWDTPLWIGANPLPARFNGPGDGPTQYLSLHPLTPWAEYLRSNDVQTEADLRGLRLRLWALRVDLAPLTQISFDSAAEHGIAPRDLVSSDWKACRRLAARLRGDGCPGIVVPSAALPGTRNVVLFGARVAAPYLLDPVDAVVDVPVSHAAEAATTIPGLLALVTRRRRPHAGLTAWRAGEEHQLVEPVATG